VTNPTTSDTNTNSSAATTDSTPPATNTAAPESNPIEPTTNAITAPAIAEAAYPVAVPPTAVTEVVDRAVDPLITPRCDLYSLLTLIAGDPGAISRARGNNAWPLAHESASVLGRRVPSFARSVPIRGLAGLLLPGQLATHARVGDAAATGLTRAVSISGYAPPAPRSVVPAAAQNFLEHTARAVLAHVSLTALAALTLPGVGGLLIVCATGVRLGYRQAKAGLALHATAIARFAGSGVLCVARSGSLVALRPWPSRVVASSAGSPTRLVDRVA
jgi:hypothetical protein